MLTGALCGVIAAGFAWINRLRWYWIVVIAVVVYLVAALIQVVGIALLARKRSKAAANERRFAKLSDEDFEVVAREFKRVHVPEKPKDSVK